MEGRKGARAQAVLAGREGMAACRSCWAEACRVDAWARRRQHLSSTLGVATHSCKPLPRTSRAGLPSQEPGSGIFQPQMSSRPPPCYGPTPRPASMLVVVRLGPVTESRCSTATAGKQQASWTCATSATACIVGVDIWFSGFRDTSLALGGDPRAKSSRGTCPTCRCHKHCAAGPRAAVISP